MSDSVRTLQPSVKDEYPNFEIWDENYALAITPGHSSAINQLTILFLTVAFFDQGSNNVDISRRDLAYPRVLVQAGDEVVFG